MAIENIKEECLLSIGTTLSNGKYRIEQYLASGGFGKTYQATDTAFDEKVAIKELYIKGLCGRSIQGRDISVSLVENQRTFAAQQEKFRKEARRLRKLSNKHIVHVHDLFDENGTTYYVMDFVEGESLSTRMKRTGKPLTESEVLQILTQLLDALDCVHADGIWHLDIKPANIMLDKQGDVLLIDFGASKQLRNKDGDSLSTSSALVYTPGYASSEQMEQNIEKFGPWTDLYSLGATLYYLLTMNALPSPSDIDEDVNEALPFGDQISKKTRELIIWMMKPNRKMRPQSVADVRQYLAEDSAVPIGQQGIKIQLDGDSTVFKPSTPKTSIGGKDSETVPSQKKKGKWAMYAVLGVLALIAVIGFAMGTMSGGNTLGNETIEALEEPITYVNDYVVNLNDLGLSDEATTKFRMDKYNYTGDVNQGVPNGKGKAIFADGRVYVGNFSEGLCSDENATFTFPNGDVFQGRVDKGIFVTGRYTIKEDGSYFEGTFKDGQPNEGEWHD